MSFSNRDRRLRTPICGSKISVTGNWVNELLEIDYKCLLDFIRPGFRISSWGSSPSSPLSVVSGPSPSPG